MGYERVEIGIKLLIVEKDLNTVDLEPFATLVVAGDD